MRAQPSLSISAAARRCAAPTLMPPIIRAISSTRSAFDRRRTLVWVLPVRLVLVDDEVSVRERRDLRQVRDAHDLTMPCDVGDGAPDHLGHRASDARVDFVEDVGADRTLIGEHPLEGEQAPGRALRRSRSCGAVAAPRPGWAR